VLPGRLSVSRTIGDVQAKLPKYGGNIKCVVCKPDVIEYEIRDTDDFILIGCNSEILPSINYFLLDFYFLYLGDGVFDNMNNKEIVNGIFNS